jgi:large subunit ribosomal protein L23
LPTETIQVIFRVTSDATKPEVKGAVELLFKVSVEVGTDCQRQGQAQEVRP